MARFGEGGCIVCLKRKDVKTVRWTIGVATKKPQTIDARVCATCGKRIEEENAQRARREARNALFNAAASADRKTARKAARHK